jgi:hypothetical protein
MVRLPNFFSTALSGAVALSGSGVICFALVELGGETVRDAPEGAFLRVTTALVNGRPTRRRRRD